MRSQLCPYEATASFDFGGTVLLVGKSHGRASAGGEGHTVWRKRHGFLYRSREAALSLEKGFGFAHVLEHPALAPLHLDFTPRNKHWWVHEPKEEHAAQIQPLPADCKRQHVIVVRPPTHLSICPRCMLHLAPLNGPRVRSSFDNENHPPT